MKKIIISILLLLGVSILAGSREIIETHSSRDDFIAIEISFTPGEHWNHHLAIISWLPLYKVKTVPQIGVWLEDTEGNYLETLYVSEKTATQGWSRAPSEKNRSIRRKSALPAWAHARNVLYPDGLFMPTEEEPLADTITGASPRGAFTLVTRVDRRLYRAVVKVELNNSCDFNSYYTKDASPDSDAYSGGEWGSGQPALVYAAELNLREKGTPVEMELVGHSSPDGSDGKVYPELVNISTAREIIKAIAITVR